MTGRIEISLRWLKIFTAVALLTVVGGVGLAILTAPGADTDIELPATTEDTQLAPPVASQPLPAASADLEKIRRIERDDLVKTQRSRPRLSVYFKDIAMAIFKGIAGWFEAMGHTGELLVSAVVWIMRVLALALVILLFWYFYSRWRRGSQPMVATTTAALVDAAPPDINWRHRLDSAIEAGRARDALEALWWWFAGQLGATDADPAWTTRELVTRTQRRELWPLVSRFDRLTYGHDEPQVEAVRELSTAVREALSRAQLRTPSGELT